MRAGSRMNRTYWKNQLRKIEAAYRFERGYKLLYCPWETLDHHKLVFLSLNPGARTPHGSGPIEQAVSDERGNSYEVEQFNSCSPISDQFLRLCAFMAVAPAEVLTGVVAPFRSASWEALTVRQRDASMDFGQRFWDRALRVVAAKCGNHRLFQEGGQPGGVAARRIAGERAGNGLGALPHTPVPNQGGPPHRRPAASVAFQALRSGEIGALPEGRPDRAQVVVKCYSRDRGTPIRLRRFLDVIARRTIAWRMRELGLRGVVLNRYVKTTIPVAKLRSPVARGNWVFQAARSGTL